MSPAESRTQRLVRAAVYRQARFRRAARPPALTAARVDDALASVTVPTSGAPSPSAAEPSHLQEVQADLISCRYPAGQHGDADALASHGTNETYAAYIRAH